ALLYVSAAGIVDRDGGLSMGIVFIIGPLGALIGGAAAALTAAFYLRRQQKTPEDGAARRRWPASRPGRIVLAAAAAGLAGYMAASVFIWLQSGITYESYWTALLIAWSPYLLGISAAALAAFIASRSPPREQNRQHLRCND
ncbi:MAG: hypothetical protein ACOYB4_09720, partial [Methyloceanibacter sp.]